MPGYTTDVVAPSIPWGTSVFNGLLGNPTESDAFDLATAYPDPNGPSRAVNPNLPGTIGYIPVTPISSLPANQQQAVTWARAGDAAVVVFQAGSAAAATNITSPGTGNWVKATEYLDATNNRSIAIWLGLILAAGTDTLTLVGGGVTGQGTVMELSAPSVANTAWSTVAGGSLQTPGSVTSWLYPSLLSGSGLWQAYIGAAVVGGSAGSATTPGFTYFTIGSNMPIGYDLALAPATTYQPNGASSVAGYADTVGTIIRATPGTLAGPSYASAASGLGGGVGSWSNPTNADGAPDAAYATWTAP